MITTLTTFITTSTAFLLAAIGAYSKLRAAMRPLLRRKKFPVAVLAQAMHQRDAVRFVADLRSAGYQDVNLTLSPSAVLGRRAVVLWHPDPESCQATVDAVHDAAPEATIIVLSHARCQVRLSESVLAANSTLRARGDLGTLSEVG